MRMVAVMFLSCVLPAQVIAEVLEDAVAALPNGRLLQETVVSAGQPDAGQLRRLADAGLAAVINLRTEGEDPGFDEAAVLREADVAYYRVPVAGAGRCWCSVLPVTGWARCSPCGPAGCRISQRTPRWSRAARPV